MKTLYQRQFTLMAGVLLVAFLLLGGAGMVSGTVLRKESRKRSGKE